VFLHHVFHRVFPCAGAISVRAIRAAIAGHRPDRLRNLARAYGAQAFARAIGTLSGRAMADALSMLPPHDRAHILDHLPPSARLRLNQVAQPIQHLHRLPTMYASDPHVASLEVAP